MISSNIDAEIAVNRMCILRDNRNYEKISDFLDEKSFYVIQNASNYFYKQLKDLLIQKY